MPLHSRTILALASLMVLGAAASDAVIAVIPAIANGSGVSIAHAQLLISCFIGGYSLGQIPSGVMADRYGRRPILYISLALFCVASLLCYVTTDFDTLLLFRFIQGLGASAGAVLARTIARDTSSGVELARLLAVLGAALSTTTIVAPLVGSLFVSYASWTDLFLLYLIQGAATLALCFACIPETHPELKLKQTGTARVRRARLLPLKECALIYFKSRQSVWAMGIMAFAFFGFATILSSFGTLCIEIYGLTFTRAGLLLSLATVFFVAGNLVSHRFVASYGSLPLVNLSIILFCTSALGFTLLYSLEVSSVAAFWMASSTYFAGIGLLFPVISSIALSPLPAVAGLASSILGSVQTFFAFMGSLLVARFYQHDISHVSYLVMAAAIALIITHKCRPEIRV